MKKLLLLALVVGVGLFVGAKLRSQ